MNNTVTVNDITQFSDWIIADENGMEPPVAEVVTIVLVAVGLVSLGGFIWWRRRRRKQAVPEIP